MKHFPIKATVSPFYLILCRPSLARFACYITATSYLYFSPPAFSQGSLTPPGPPAPTMKRLDEVEPRTNLQAAPAPVGVDTTDANFHFVISQPGSYYLSANLAVTKANGIQVNAEGVTLDLNGFQISRTSGTGGDGIQIAVNSHRTTILNGSIKGFAFGTNSIDGISGARGCKLRDLSVSGCTSTAIFAGPGALIESCLVHDNTSTNGFLGGYGSSLKNCTATANVVVFAISAGVGSTLVDCKASNNSCAIGIFADGGSSLTNCNAFLNTSSAGTSSGIATGTGCTVTACTAASTGSTAGTLTPTTGIGFDIGANNTIQGCTASKNRGDGIRLGGSSLARNNNCATNGANGGGAGIHALSSRNRIEANNVVANDRGIHVDSPGNVIVTNTARGNAVNYDIAVNNVFGAIVDQTELLSAAVVGNAAPASVGTTDPWANISY